MQNASEASRDIFVAAQKNDILEVKSFIEEHHIPISVTNDLRQTLAHTAAKSGSLDVIKYVAQQLPSILTKTDKYDFTALRLAVREGALNIVQYLVENHEADLTKRSDRDFRSTSVHTAIKYGRLEILKYLFEEKNFDINVLGEWMNQPPVFSAVQYRQENIIKYLIDQKNVDLQVLDSHKQNILYVSVRIDDLPFMKYILDQKILPFDLNWKNSNGETLAFRAATSNRTSILEYLVGEKNVDINIASDSDQLTPLHCAAIQGNYEICQYLVDHGAKPDLKDNQGQIPADKASDKKLKLYLKSASILKAQKVQIAQRNRRSVFQPILAPSDERTQGRIYGRISGASTAVSSVDIRSYMSEFRNFLTIAGLIFKNTNSSFCQMGVLLSPLLILKNRIDPNAVEAINCNPNKFL